MDWKAKASFNSRWHLAIAAIVLLLSTLGARGAVVEKTQTDGWLLFCEGGSAPFAEMSAANPEVKIAVRTKKGSPFVFIDVAPATGRKDRKPGVVALPTIRLASFSVAPVKMGSAGLGRVGDGVVSCGYLAVAEPRSRRGVVAAWLTNLKASGALATRMDADGRVVVEPIADYGPMLVKAGERQVYDTIVIGAFDDCRLGLEAYADEVAERFAIRLPPNRSGYCTWCSDRYGYSDTTEFKRGCGAGTEASTCEYADFAVRILKPYGFDFIQIDDQWQAGNPDLNGPARNFSKTASDGGYPYGFRTTVERLTANGIDAGLWFIPFGGVADDPAWAGKTDLFVRSAVDVPETVRCNAFESPLVLARGKGAPLKTEWGGECLDMTNPKTREHVMDTVRRFTRDWGFRYLKADGLFTGFGCDLYGGYAWKDVNFANATFFEPMASNVSAFRKGLETVRSAAAPGTFILGCNLGTIRAMVPSFGLVDGMRIGNDNGPIDQFPERYLEGPRAGTCRYFLNGRVWWNDPDSTYVRAATPVERARSMASWTALTDSLFEIGDWLPDLPDERVEILRRTLAHHGRKTVRPIDYFEREIPNGWILDGGESKVVGVFNWNTNDALSVDWPFAYVGLDPSKEYVGFDFWRNEFIPPFSGVLKLEVPPDDCRVIALSPIGDQPVLVSTSRHVASPVFDVRATEWRPTADGGVCSGESSGLVAGERCELRFALPKGWEAEGASNGFVCLSFVPDCDRAKCSMAFRHVSDSPGMARVRRTDFRIRDPFVLAENGVYYLYSSVNPYLGVSVRTSKTLEYWTGAKQVMRPPTGVEVTDIWAPEVHKFGGTYYLFATLTEKKGSVPVDAPADGRDIRFNNVHAKSLEHPLISGRPGNPLKSFSFTDCAFRKVSDDELPGWKRHGPAVWERVPKTTFEHVEGFTYNNTRFDAP